MGAQHPHAPTPWAWGWVCERGAPPCAPGLSPPGDARTPRGQRPDRAVPVPVSWRDVGAVKSDLCRIPPFPRQRQGISGAQGTGGLQPGGAAG